MFITFNQVIAHLVGDYVLQTEWMAKNKTKNLYVSALHALTYSLPFLLFHPSWFAMFVIIWTHSVIDRFRLARWVCAWKNGRLRPTTVTGLSDPLPHSKLTTDNIRTISVNVWILILLDNLMHITINGLALKYL